MSASELISEINKLSDEEQKRVFVFLAGKLLPQVAPHAKQWLGRKMSFEQACDVIFRENRELLGLLAK